MSEADDAAAALRIVNALSPHEKATLLRLAVEAGATIEPDGIHFAAGQAQRFVQSLMREHLLRFTPEGPPQ